MKPHGESWVGPGPCVIYESFTKDPPHTFLRVVPHSSRLTTLLDLLFLGPETHVRPHPPTPPPCPLLGVTSSRFVTERSDDVYLSGPKVYKESKGGKGYPLVGPGVGTLTGRDRSFGPDPGGTSTPTVGPWLYTVPVRLPATRRRLGVPEVSTPTPFPTERPRRRGSHKTRWKRSEWSGRDRWSTFCPTGTLILVPRRTQGKGRQ